MCDGWEFLLLWIFSIQRLSKYARRYIVSKLCVIFVICDWNVETKFLWNGKSNIKKLKQLRLVVMSSVMSMSCFWFCDYGFFIRLITFKLISSNFSTVFSESFIFKDTHRERVPSNKTPALTKSKNMGIWVVGTSVQLFRSS